MRKPDDSPIEKGESSFGTINTTEWWSARGAKPTIEMVTVDQTIDVYYHEAATQVKMSEWESRCDVKELLVTTLKTDGCQQKVVPVFLLERFFIAEHYLQISGRPGECDTCMTVQKKFFWPHMANDVYDTVSKLCNMCKQSQMPKNWRIPAAILSVETVWIYCYMQTPPTAVNENRKHVCHSNKS